MSWRRAGLLLIIAVTAVACGGSNGDIAAAPAAEQLLADAGIAMRNVETVRFDIEVQGAPVSLDGSGLLTGRSAVGDYRSPGSFRAVVQGRAAGIPIEIGAIAIGPDKWITNPLTGTWEALGVDNAFDPLRLFARDGGIGDLLATGVAAPLVVDADGNRFAVAGTVDGADVQVITAGLIEEDDVQVTVWIDDGTWLVSEMTFTTGAGDDASNWTVLLSGYDAEVTIAPPPLDD